MQDFEKLGVFYLGRQYDQASRQAKPEFLLYDSKDLTTHAVCVGMTGSGKTGLCLALLEEAAIDGIPAIAIDPKGDLGNLMLTFPELRPADFRPWIDESEATRKGLSSDEMAAKTAQTWREGLASWGEDGARIQRFRDSAEVAIYTPGSSAGLPLTVLRSFAAPPAAIRSDADTLRERIGASVSGLLTLLGVAADPVRSREHILLSQVLDNAWRQGRDLDMAGLIAGIQSPAFERVGVVDVETFFPAKERFELAMRINNLLASPGFAGWMEGEPLDVGKLLYTASGRPRLSVLSIAHLSETERMFFVTVLLGEILTWVRSQSGTSSLRAILYMDEVFGYFPPTANPPSKTPMLTLLKQARAYGLGIVLATQNPVDLDYKGLSNTGTWLLGRLQTERDKARVLEGLEGASAAAGSKFNRPNMEATLAGLGNRVFLMNNVHEDQPVVFESRWCLSYLRGPLTRGQIQSLMAGHIQRQETATVAAASGAGAVPPAPSTPAPTSGQGTSAPSGAAAGARPLVPPEAAECFLPSSAAGGKDDQVVYRPGLMGVARVHFVDAKSGLDHWQDIALWSEASADATDDIWERADSLEGVSDAEAKPAPGAAFAPIPAAFGQAKNYPKWKKSLADFLYRHQSLPLSVAAELKEFSRPGESDAEFRVRLQHRGREQRDHAIEKLRQKYAAKIAAAQTQARRADERVAREKSQFQNQALQTAVSLGSSLLGALMGRKLASRTNVTSAASTVRSAGRAAREREDIGRATQESEAAATKLAELEDQLKAEIEQQDALAGQIEITSHPVKARKSDISVTKVALAWSPD